VTYHDPYIPAVRLDGGVLESVELTAGWLAEADAVVWVTDHSAYDRQWILDNARLVVDTRNATRGFSGRARVVGL